MPRRRFLQWNSESSSFLASTTQNSLALLLLTSNERDGRYQLFDEMPRGRYLQALTQLTAPPPPPPFLPPFETQRPSSSSGHGVNPSIIIIALILALVFLISASLHFILRYIDRVRHPPYVLPTTSPPSPPNTHQPLVDHGNHQRHAASSDPGQALVDSLPSFSFDSIAAFQKSSAPDCAVCLSRFESGDQLRFLPACCHAFHARCIDVWLASNRTCPLCRSTIHVPFDSAKTSDSGNGSESFRIEVGNVSRRRAAPDSSAGSRRSYSMGSFDYIIDDDLAAEVVVAAVATAHSRGLSSGRAKEEAEQAAPGIDAAEAVGGGSSGRGWLRDYVDRLTASASSSFSSSRGTSFRLRGSGGGGSSRRSEAGLAGGGGSWDVGEEAGAFFRWLVGG